RHPVVMLPALLAAAATLLVCAVIGTAFGLAWVWWAWVLSLGYLGWKVIAWSVEFFIVTEHRSMVVTGVLNRTVLMMPLGKVTDIELQRSVPGRMLGYGEFVIESAGQKKPLLHRVRFMPYPEQLYLECCSVVFSSEDESPD
ncbi:PH domain-containing protein, partial [Actinomadura adrarensis]